MDIWIIIIGLMVVYLYISAIIGIRQKKFSAAALAFIFGVKIREVGTKNYFRKFENEEAIGAALAQIFVATIGLIAIGWSLIQPYITMNNYFLMQKVFSSAIAIAAIATVIVIIKIIVKKKELS